MRSRRLGVQEERAFIDRRCLAPLALNDDLGCAVNQPYRRLPQPFYVNLSVLKLDGSLFDVCVSQNATVAELKWAVEEVFAARQKEISWSHVWGHFCLSYNGQKLINDKACLPKFGIKDGDQLQFTRHMSIQNSLLRERPKNNFSCKLLSLSSSKSNAHEEKKDTGSGDINNDENQDSSKCHGYNQNQEEDPIPESKFGRVFRGCLSTTSSLWGITRNAPNCLLGLKHCRN